LAGEGRTVHPHISAILDKARQEKPLSVAEGYRLINCTEAEVPAILTAAGDLRDCTKGRTITYSRKVFLPVTNLCRDRCSYCTFRKDPRDPDAWTMTPEEIQDWVVRGRAHGCKEALMCLGDKPELAYSSYRTTLANLGHKTTTEYIYRACEIALSHGMLPHTNAGVMSYEEMKWLKEVNVSLGLMLENISPRLRQRGMVHFSAPDKDPEVRVRMLREAGDLAIPFTTGILIGIGETLEERVDSLLAIRAIHREYGHIQEVIVQNFRAKPRTRMADAPEPESVDMAKTVAVARLLLGGQMNVQAPPNLSPLDHKLLLRAGINDWGGISPVTKDYVNPEAAWPHLDLLAQTCQEEGFTLRERLAIYPEYINRPGFLLPALRPRTQELYDQVTT
jgi:FO synthase